MNAKEQGVHTMKQDRFPFVLPLLLLLICLSNTVRAEPTPDDEKNNDPEQQDQLIIVFSQENTLHSKIVDKLIRNLGQTLPDILIQKISPQSALPSVSKNDLLLSFSIEDSKYIQASNPSIKTLQIMTDPNKPLEKQQDTDNRAVLYMTQPYCKRLALIKQINNSWKTIGLLNSKEIITKELEACAVTSGMKLYQVQATSDTLASDLKQVLDNADLLLALPDNNIYNQRTVKNILLTSYRYRKPVIAFSENFVNAGALAAISSNSDQIADTASRLVEHYFSHKYRFQSAVNYPEDFEISLNRQVFRALQIPLPDVDLIEQHLSSDHNAGKRQ
jgi:putative tryptophan/tyrosine transport system substrate-binding protein